MESAFDRALLEVGQNGYFQKKFDIIYNVILSALWCMAYMSIFLALVIIPHHCKIPNKTKNINISDLSWKLKFIPASKDVNGNIKLSSCLKYIDVNVNNKTIECNEFMYDQTWYESTVSSDNDWVCDKELYVANVFAYNMIGEMIGSIIFGWFGDVYGRRLSYILALAMIVLGRLMSILAGGSYVLFVIGCFIASFPSWSVVQSATVISLEISSSKRRTRTATFRFLALSFGVCLMSLLYWWLREWKLFLTVSTASLIPFLLLSRYIIESPRWLWLKGNPEESIHRLKQIAKANRTNLQIDTEQDLLTEVPARDNKTLGPLALFSGWRLAINTILQLCLWVCVTLSYTVLLMMSGEKSDGNPFLEFAWQAAIEMPGNVIGAWLADQLGRRASGIISYCATASMWMLISYRENYTNAWLGSWWIGITLRTICRLSTTSSYYTINLFNMELYPTCLRQTGMSLGNVFSSGASAVAPYIMHLGRHFNSRLPGVILAGASIIGAISSFLLPETLNTKLPETLEDALQFGSDRDKRYFTIFFKRPVSKQEKEEESTL